MCSLAFEMCTAKFLTENVYKTSWHFNWNPVLGLKPRTNGFLRCPFSISKQTCPPGSPSMPQCLLLAYPAPYSELWSPGAALPPMTLPYSHFCYTGLLYPLPSWPPCFPLFSLKGIKNKSNLVSFRGLCQYKPPNKHSALCQSQCKRFIGGGRRVKEQEAVLEWDRQTER